MPKRSLRVRTILEFWGRVQGSVQGGTNKCIRQGAKESGQICTSYEHSELGNFGVAQKVITHMCPFQSVLWERAWKAIGDRLQRPHYLSRIDHERKIGSRRQRTDVGKYSFVNRTIQQWNQLPAEVLRNLPCKPITFKKRVRKVIIELKRKYSVLEIIEKCREAKSSEVQSYPI